MCPDSAATMKKYSNIEPKKRSVVATLDLHGLAKERAIFSLTSFLSAVTTKASSRWSVNSSADSDKTQLWTRQKYITNNVDEADGIWVQIITGKGIHSSNGPVLRNAVKSTLDKRCMIYQLMNDKGAFLVRADSGHQLYGGPPPVDTKIVLVNKDECRSTASLDDQHSKGKPCDSLFFNVLDPLPSQVHAEEEDIRLAKKLSSHEEQLRQNNCHDKQMKQVIKESLESASHTRKQKSLQDEEDEIRSACTESIREKQQVELEEQLELSRALAASQLQLEEDEYHRLTFDDNEDLILRRILDLSKEMS